MAVIREMLPEDLLSYCQEHGLLESVLGAQGPPPPATAATSDYSATYAAMS